MRIGKRVTWWHVPRGGYGYPVYVAAVVRKVGAVRVQIACAVRVDHEWRKVLKWIHPDKLTPRDVFVEGVDDAPD